MGLFDVHAHLTHGRFASDLSETVQRARAAGLTSIISNGLNLEDNRAVLALARREPLVKPALGFYPVDAVLSEMRAAGVDYPRDDDEEALPEQTLLEPRSPEHRAQETLAFIRENIANSIAVGEVGLDGYWVPEPFWARQDEVFGQLVRLALEFDRPLIVHSRKRELRTLEILEALGARRVNWHCFGSKLKLAQKVAELGHYVSIPANARRSEGFTRMLQKLPRNQLLLETDCPYLGPRSGERNEPANVAETLDYAAELWQIPREEALEQFSLNYTKLFGQAP